MMVKVCLALAFFCLGVALPAQAFTWDTATSNGREYVTLQSFCTFYSFAYENPGGNATFDTRNGQHTLRLKGGSPDMFLDGVHYVMSFPVEKGDHDWLVSRMDVIKLFEPIVRPTAIEDRHVIRGVVIDAGHGGTDNGAVSARGGMEKRYTLDTAFRLEAILRQMGLKTVLTRRSDFFVDLYERAHIASLYPDYAFVSIHFNSASPEARGLETYCLSPRGAASTSSNYLTRGDIQKLPGNDFDASNILLASMVHSEIIKLNPGDTSMDRGVKRARFVVIKQNVLPAILVEGGFVSNRIEAARVDTDKYHQDLATAIARGVVRFINVMSDKRLPLPGGGSSAPPVPMDVPTPTVVPAPAGMARDSAETPGDRPTVNSSNVSKASGPLKALPVPPSSTGPKSATTPGANPIPSGVATTTGSHKKKDKKKIAVATPELAPTPPASITDTVKKDIQAGDSSSNTSTTSSTDTTVPPPIPTPSPTTTPAVTPTTATDTAPADKPAEKTNAPLNLTEPAAPPPRAISDKPAAEPDEPPVNIYSTTPKAAPDTKPTDSPKTNSPSVGPNAENP